jgi:hypothetical protein
MATRTKRRRRCDLDPSALAIRKAALGTILECARRWRTCLRSDDESAVAEAASELAEALDALEGLPPLFEE